MARKKKQVEPEEPAVLVMSREELYSARMYIAEAELAQLQMALVLAKKKEHIRQIDPEGRLDAFDLEFKELAGRASQRRSGYNEALASVGDRLEIPMGEFAWDDETGLLSRIETEDDELS